MKLEQLRQPPHNTTRMGVLHGVIDYYGLPVSRAMAYGGSGHAFLMNIHEALCPSGPYCWDDGPTYPLLANLGVRMTDLGFYWNEGGATDRATLETRLRESLDSGRPCALVNMENQLITGYDDTGFLTAQPWPCNDFPPAHLTFGSWAELGGEIHINFYAFDRCEPAPVEKTVRESLEYALDLHRNPGAHTSEKYGVGPNAYRNWIEAVRAGHGNSHGNWWNGVVWAECRAQAADYFRQIAASVPRSADAACRLSSAYEEIGSLLQRCSDKELDAEAKIGLLREAAEREAACVPGLEALVAAMCT